MPDLENFRISLRQKKARSSNYMYRFLIRPVLFLFDPETIHHFTFKILSVAGKIPALKTILRNNFTLKDKRLERTILGLHFPNPIGLAAGFDKDAKLIDELACFGFGFIEIGTLTPKGQSGNDRPRLFRLPEDQAVINRMGFNNEGVLIAVERLKKRESSRGVKVIVGGNIGKNKTTPNESAFEDYKICFEALYPYVDYFVVNVSSPNTPNLRELQEKEPLKKLLTQVKALSLAKEKSKPVLLKIAPDLNESQLKDIVEILLETKTDGVIAANTTISREGLIASNDRIEKIGAGGLSGKPLTNRSNEIISFLRVKLGNDYPIIGVGGVMTPKDALEKLKAGADLIQIYTGFIYEGPGFVKEINKTLSTNSTL
jgi:dihydroorotate dehydrogenase